MPNIYRNEVAYLLYNPCCDEWFIEIFLFGTTLTDKSLAFTANLK